MPSRPFSILPGRTTREVSLSTPILNFLRRIITADQVLADNYCPQKLSERVTALYSKSSRLPRFFATLDALHAYLSAGLCQTKNFGTALLFHTLFIHLIVPDTALALVLMEFSCFVSLSVAYLTWSQIWCITSLWCNLSFNVPD